MLLIHFFALLLATPLVYSQILYDVTHNATSLVGTWSSGSKAVSTGPVSAIIQNHRNIPTHASQGFANPTNMSFTYPSVTGISYSLCAYIPSLTYSNTDHDVLVRNSTVRESSAIMRLRGTG